MTLIPDGEGWEVDSFVDLVEVLQSEVETEYPIKSVAQSRCGCGYLNRLD